MLRVLIVSVILFLLVPAPVDAHSGRWYVNSENGLRLRQCPSADCKSIRTIPFQGVVTAFKHRGNWAQIQYKSSIGWVSLDFIQKNKPEKAASGLQTCFPNSWGQVVCAPEWIAETVYAAASYYGVRYYTMMSLAACESNYVTSEYSWAGAIGIFQFLESTFYSYGSGDVWSVSDQSRVAAYMISIGEIGQWDCSWRI